MRNPQTSTQTEVTLLVPTREQVEGLKVGDLAIDAFGKMRRVTSIFGRGYDMNRHAYVCYYTENGPGSTMSNSMKEGELVRTVATSNAYCSAALDAIERDINKASAARAACAFCSDTAQGKRSCCPFHF